MTEVTTDDRDETGNWTAAENSRTPAPAAPRPPKKNLKNKTTVPLFGFCCAGIGNKNCLMWLWGRVGVRGVGCRWSVIGWAVVNGELVNDDGEFYGGSNPFGDFFCM